MAMAKRHEREREHERQKVVRISDLARRVGLDKGHVSRILGGAIQPTMPVAKKIADGMGVSLDDLYERLTA